MEDKIILPTMEVIEGEPYEAQREVRGYWWDTITRTDYIRFRWSTGFLVMRKAEFDQNKRLQKLILDTILGKEKKAKAKKVKR